MEVKNRMVLYNAFCSYCNIPFHISEHTIKEEKQISCPNCGTTITNTEWHEVIDFFNLDVNEILSSQGII